MLCVCLLYFDFFFFKQKTAYEMRISDWSSDVCSSDLTVLARFCKSLTLSIETEWLVMRVALADLAVSVRGKKLAKRRGAPGGLVTGDGRLANAGVSRWNVRNIRPTNSISTDRKSVV